MEIQGEKTVAAFMERLTRFSALVEVDEHTEVVHLPNSGRMTELLVAGRPTLLVKKPSPSRKTTYDMVMVSMNGLWVSVDSRMPSQLVEEALREKKLAPFQKYPIIRREAFYQGSRLDFRLEKEGEACFLEAKSVNLVVNGVALFPDAPTQRGARHLRTLVEAKRQGYEGAVIFVIQRHDAWAFSPYHQADPYFAQALQEAAASGVGIYAHRCRVSPNEITLEDAAPVFLTPENPKKAEA